MCPALACFGRHFADLGVQYLLKLRQVTMRHFNTKTGQVSRVPSSGMFYFGHCLQDQRMYLSVWIEAPVTTRNFEDVCKVFMYLNGLN